MPCFVSLHYLITLVIVLFYLITFILFAFCITISVRTPLVETMTVIMRRWSPRNFLPLSFGAYPELVSYFLQVVESSPSQALSHEKRFIFGNLPELNRKFRVSFWWTAEICRTPAVWQAKNATENFEMISPLSWVKRATINDHWEIDTLAN